MLKCWIIGWFAIQVHDQPKWWRRFDYKCHFSSISPFSIAFQFDLATPPSPPYRALTSSRNLLLSSNPETLIFMWAGLRKADIKSNAEMDGGNVAEVKTPKVSNLIKSWRKICVRLLKTPTKKKRTVYQMQIQWHKHPHNGIRLPFIRHSPNAIDIYLSVDPNNIVNSKISSLAWMPCTVCEQLRIDWNMDLSKMRLTVRLFNVCISLGFYVCMRIGMECAFFGRRIYTQRNGMDWVMDSHFVWSRAYLVNFVKQPKSSEQSTHRWWHAFKSLKKIIVLAQCDGYSFDESLWFLWLDQRERERKRKW